MAREKPTSKILCYITVDSSPRIDNNLLEVLQYGIRTSLRHTVKIGKSSICFGMKRFMNQKLVYKIGRKKLKKPVEISFYTSTPIHAGLVCSHKF